MLLVTPLPGACVKTFFSVMSLDNRIGPIWEVQAELQCGLEVRKLRAVLFVSSLTKNTQNCNRYCRNSVVHS